MGLTFVHLSFCVLCFSAVMAEGCEVERCCEKWMRVYSFGSGAGHEIVAGFALRGYLFSPLGGRMGW